MKEKEILECAARIGITELNPMQRQMMEKMPASRNILLLSPTGSGKTLAFVLPLLKLLRPSTGQVQALVIAPSRELVLQIAGVIRSLGTPFRVSALYGGHKVEDEVNELRTAPDIVVATPGRLLDQMQRRNIEVLPCRIAVLDEYDKSLELGFEDDMRKIFARLKNLSRLILTSATDAPSIPDFLPFDVPLTLSFLTGNAELQTRMRTLSVASDSRDKLQSLLALLRTISAEGPLERTIIFVNHRESAERVAAFLLKEGVSAVLYHGALDQTEREKAIALFTSGARNVLVSTDLGARGLDIPQVKEIVHYHLPLTGQAWTHRNGRTARVDADGTIYVLLSGEESAPEYMEFDDAFALDANATGHTATGLDTLYIGAGRKEKISKGDILGWLAKDCGLPASEIGAITLSDHYTLVALPSASAADVAARGANQRIKGAKRRVSLVAAS